MATETTQNTADQRLDQKQQVMDGEAKQPLTTVNFNRETRTWRFTYKDPSGEEFTYELTMKANLFNTSIHLLRNKKRHLETLVTGKIVKEDGTLGEALFNTIIAIPNLWPTRDEHTVLSKEESATLAISVIRDTNYELVERSIRDWFMKEVQRSGAINFNLSVN